MAETRGQIIDGKKIAEDIRKDVKMGVEGLGEKERPRLSVILVGDRKDSATYVGMKKKACTECGIESEVINLPANATEDEVVQKVKALNANHDVDGILVQLPLPSHVNEKKVLELIDWQKDVDGLHPLNVGNLALRDRVPRFKPCTAEGCIELLRRSGVTMSGANAVVIGRSNIVGLPVSLLLQQENATVTMCHSRTADIPLICKNADIVVSAIGKPNFLQKDWLKEGAVVIDVGINCVDDSSVAKGYRLVGDVDFQACKPICSCITPVPGGVGPMTVAMLMKNTFLSRQARIAERA